MTLDETLDMYWAAAYAEGQRGATHEGGLAQTALNAVHSCVRLAIQAAITAEREACALVCDARANEPLDDEAPLVWMRAAEAIRERSASMFTGV